MKTNLPTIEKYSVESFHHPKYINEGVYGKIYQVSPNICGKILFGDKSKSKLNIKRLRAEFEIAKELYEGGVSVPRPFGVYELDLTPENCFGLSVTTMPSFIMEYINGINVGLNYENELSRMVSSKLIDEIDKSKKLGFFLDLIGIKKEMFCMIQKMIGFV